MRMRDIYRYTREMTTFTKNKHGYRFVTTAYHTHLYVLTFVSATDNDRGTPLHIEAETTSLGTQHCILRAPSDDGEVERRRGFTHNLQRSKMFSWILSDDWLSIDR